MTKKRQMVNRKVVYDTAKYFWAEGGGAWVEAKVFFDRWVTSGTVFFLGENNTHVCKSTHDHPVQENPKFFTNQRILSHIEGNSNLYKMTLALWVWLCNRKVKPLGLQITCDLDHEQYHQIILFKGSNSV